MSLNVAPFLRRTLYLALFASIPFQAHSAAHETANKEMNQLQFEINQLKLINERQQKTLSLMEARLQAIESGKTVPSVEQAPAQQAADAGEPVKRSADPSRSVENILSEEHALFSRKTTFEAGMTYSHYDRKQLVLDGFLALDAIFLGNISVDDVSSDILTLNLGLRHNVTDRWQLGISAPLVNRWSTFEKSDGAGTTATADVDRIFTPGDLQLTSSYQLYQETPDMPDVVWNVRVKAPTGKHPYGIATRNIGAPTNLTTPVDLPTGSGLWAVGTGFSFLKTIDPAILFASLEYTHQFANDFDDISSVAGAQPGSVRLGDSIDLGLGVAFAVNDRMSLSFSYAQRFQNEAETRLAGGGWSEVVGSDANAATFNTGVTYSLNSNLSMSTNLSVGLTPDAPDFSIGVNFPYSM